MKKFLQTLTLLTAMLLCGAVHAQVSEYQFATGVDTTQWITLSNNAWDTTEASSVGTGDYFTSNVLNIGFSFDFAGTSYTQFSMNSDGCFHFGSTNVGTGSYTNPFSSTTAATNAPKIIGIGRDGRMNGTGNASLGCYLKYEVVGTAGNRILVAEFNVAAYSSPYPLQKWQVQLFESTGIVKIVYGDVPASNSATTYQIGMSTSSTDALTINPVTHTVSYGTSSTGTNPSTAWPEKGRYYQFSPANCRSPREHTCSNILTTEATLSWTPGGEESQWLVYADTLPFNAATATLTSASDTVISLTGLEANTLYYYAVAAVCSANDTSSWKTGTFRTACVPYTFDDLPIVEDFDTYGTGTTAFPACWSRMGSTADRPYLHTTASYAYGGTGSALYFYATNTGYCYAIMPPYEDDINQLSVNFWARQYSTGYNCSIEVGVMTDPTDTSTFTLMSTFHPNGTTYENFEAYLSTYTGNGQYIAFRSKPVASSYQYIMLDQVTIGEMPSCPAPTNLVASNPSAESITLSWVENGSATSWNLVFDTIPIADSLLNEYSPIAVTENPYTVTGLDETTSYYFYIQSDCSGENSPWTGPTSMITGFTCDENEYAAAIIPGNNTSSTTLLYGGWGNSVSQTIYTAEELNSMGIYGGYFRSMKLEVATVSTIYSKNQMLCLATTGESTVSSMITTGFTPVWHNTANELTPGVHTLMFDSAYYWDGVNNICVMFINSQDATSGTTATGTSGSPYINVNNGGSTSIWYRDGNPINFNNFSGVTTTTTVTNRVAWTFEGCMETTAPDCATPINFVCLTNDTVSATLSWDGGNNTDFDLVWGLGLDPDSIYAEGIDMLYVSADSVTVSTLTAGNVYHFWVRSNCGGDYSPWRGPLSVSTRLEYFMPITGTDTIHNACGYTIYDNGGPNGDYANSCNGTVVLMAGPNQIITLSGSYDTESGYDQLTIYDGATQLGVFDGTGVLAPIESASGSFTISFTSDGSVPYSGFVFQTLCEDIPDCPRPSTLQLVSIDSTGADLSWPSVATAASYDVAFGFSGFDPDTVSANLITGIYDTAYHVSNLMTGYSYEFYVRSDCGGSQSPWRGPVGGLIANHISMASGTNTITGCGFLITDDGGTTGNYSNSFDGTLVVNPLPGNLITISGTYNTETNYDKLSIYEGVGTSGTPILLEASGMGTVPSYVSEDGAVTIVFHTDASVNGYDGFELMLGCVPAPACMRPRALATNNTTATSTDLTWDGGANDMGYVLEWDTITNTNFTNANSVATSTNLYSLTGLTPNSQYHFRVLAICNNGDTTDWCRTPLAFTTTQTAATLPYSYDFEDPTEWAAWSTNSNNTVTWVRGAAGQSALGAAGDTMGVFVSGDGTTTTFVYDVNNIALYRDIDFGPVQSQFVMEFDARMGGCANGRYDGLMVFLVDPSAPVVASTSGITSPWGNVNDLYRVASVRYTDLDNDSAWTHFTCEFDTVSGIQRVAFFWFNQATSTYTMVGGMAQLDNLSIYEASCGRPVGLHVVDNSITTNSATLTWMGDATTSYIVTYREYYNGQNIEVPVVGNTLTLTGLASATDYVAWVRKVCSATDTSNLSDGILFTTECDAITMPYAQNFDGVTTTQSTYTGVLPNCWTIAAIDASSMSTSNMPQIYWNSTSTYSTSGQYSLHMYYRGILALPESAVPVDSLQMTFNLKQTASSYQLVVGVLDSITPGCEASFTAIDTLVCSSTSNFEPFTVYFSNYAGTGRYIAFRNHNTNGYDYSYNYIDDVVIDYTPSCLPVLNVHGDLSLATSSSITLDWTDLGTPAGQYEVQYGNADFTLGQGTSIYVTSHPTVIGGLQPVSNYKFYVRPICSAGDTAIWSQPGIAATGMCDGAIFDTIGTESNTAYQYPVNNYYRYTQSQTIYTVADLDSMAKTLNGIMYQYGYTSPSTTKTDVSIYLSHTNKDAFSNSSDFVNIDSTFVLVYQGDLNASMGWNRYAFSQEFQYNGTDNLLVTVIDNSGAYNNSSYVWNTSACNGSMTIVGYSDTYAPTTSNLTGYSGTKAAYSYRVNTMFISCGGAAVCRTPVVASVSNIDYQSATINWTGTGSNYEVEVKPTSQGIWNDQPTAVAGLTYTFTGLNPATEYQFRVRQDCDTLGYSDWAFGTFTTDSLPCFAPTNLTASNIQTLQADLSWTAGSSETSWMVKYWYGQVFDSVVVSANPTTLTGLMPATAYTAQVKALCGNGTVESDWSDPVSFTTATCAIPTNVAVSNITSNSATVAWTEAGTATEWEISYSYSGFAYDEGTKVTVTTPSYTITGLDANTAYEVMVKANCGGTMSDASARASFTTLNGGGDQGIDNVDGITVSLYPNPTSTSATISLTGVEGTVELTIVDMSGRSVMAESVECASADCVKTLDVRNLAAGAYFVRVSNDSVNMVKRLIVK